MTAKVVIGIQARSTSKRFPNKVFLPLGGKPVLEHVVQACQNAAQYLNNWSTKGIFVRTVLCIPKDDPISNYKWGDAEIFQGDEHDVLKRYADLCRHYRPDYVVRITGDCPLIPSFVISKCITTAIMNRYDYFSNVEESCRTSADGTDCEVISRDALLSAHDCTNDAFDREHVTPFIRRDKERFRQGPIVNFFDLSHLKLSLDTQEDFEEIKIQFETVEQAFLKAQKIFGKTNVHRF